MRLAVVTSEQHAQLLGEDQALVRALGAHGVQGTPCVWTNTSVDWSGFSAALIRSPWDYHHRAEEFALWLDRIEALSLPLWNPVPTVRWNMHKSYLIQLGDRGVPLPGTRVLRRGEQVLLDEVTRAWPSAVVKPAVSGGAHETFLVDRDGIAGSESRFAALLASGDVLVQEYCPEIAQSGELSLVFIGAELTHAVRKVPRTSDFRVQERFGGTKAPHRATTAERRAAEMVLDATHHLGFDWLYARVDMVRHNGRLCLMELEMIEPSLFLETVPEAVDPVASKIAARLL